MEVPPLQGFKPGKLIGYGGCGRVYQTQDEAGAACVIKIFDEDAISRRLAGEDDGAAEIRAAGRAG